MASTKDLIAAAAASGWDGADLVHLMNVVVEHNVPAIHALGIRVVELRPGHAVATVPLEGNGNHLGTMYAGTLFCVAEMLGGAIFLSTFAGDDLVPIVKDLQISYTRLATTDVRAEASLDATTTARVSEEAVRRGKADFVLNAAITDETGQVVATTHGTYQLRASS